MKGLLISLGAAAVLAAALPAAAQSWDGPGFGRNSYDNRGGSGQIERRIEQGVRDGSLTRSEANRLRDRLQDLRRLEWRYGRDGFISGSEGRELDRRYAELNRRLFVERRDNDYRGYGRNDRGWNDRDYRGWR